jgi:hypothetical protein
MGGARPMPRVRMLWPEHLGHRKVGALSDRHYRLWVGMIVQADDEGRLIADPGELRAKIFPFHPAVTVGQVRTGLQELAARHLIQLYALNGEQYAVFPSWKDWQKPRYPTPSKCPPPPSLVHTDQDYGRAASALRQDSHPDRTELDRIELDRMGSGSVGRTVSNETGGGPKPTIQEIADRLAAKLRLEEEQRNGTGGLGHPG